MKTKSQLCNDALRMLTIQDDVSDIENPVSRWEKECASVYEDTLKLTLTKHMPSFAISPAPVRISKNADDNFLIPQNSLRIVKVNGMFKDFHEMGGCILMDVPTGTAIDVLFVRYLDDTSLYTAEFNRVFAAELAVALSPCTKDVNIMQLAERRLISETQNFGGVNAQKLKIQQANNAMYKNKWRFPWR